jgi:kynurenine formamidase
MNLAELPQSVQGARVYDLCIILEALNMEELAAARVYEFLFVATPLKIRGGTGSPIRPLAVVV